MCVCIEAVEWDGFIAIQLQYVEHLVILPLVIVRSTATQKHIIAGVFFINAKFHAYNNKSMIMVYNGIAFAWDQPVPDYTWISVYHESDSQCGYSQWTSIVSRFVPVGLCLIAVMQWRYYRKRSSQRMAKQWEIDCYCMLPLRTVSRYWGWLADKKLPEFMRPYVYGLYANTFGVNLAEAYYDDYKAYGSLADFFARPLKPGARSVDTNCDLVSPCDGTLLHYGTVQTGKVEQVKGVTYSLEDFLGENTWNNRENSTGNYSNTLSHRKNKNKTLYQCVIYLAPGDYHRFHSPTEWIARYRRHFHGQLLSVSPKIAKWLPGLFCLNERVVYLGEWKHGFFSYTAVGATNVGTVRVYFDKMLQTNLPKSSIRSENAVKDNKNKTVNVNQLSSRNISFDEGVNLKRGQTFGEFRMGSTIVMVFEAPDFRFTVAPGDQIRMGEKLGNVIDGHNDTERFLMQHRNAENVNR